MEKRPRLIDNSCAEPGEQMLKAGITIAAVAAALVAAKQSNALERAQLLSSCSEVTAPQTVEDRTLLACRAGKLDGMPDLSLKSCDSLGPSGAFEYWTCPTRLSSGRSPE